MEDLLGTIINGGSQHNFRERQAAQKIYTRDGEKIHTHGSLDMQSGKTRHASSSLLWQERTQQHFQIAPL